jgi:hypothetical protein
MWCLAIQIFTLVLFEAQTFAVPFKHTNIVNSLCALTGFLLDFLYPHSFCLPFPQTPAPYSLRNWTNVRHLQWQQPISTLKKAWYEPGEKVLLLIRETPSYRAFQLHSFFSENITLKICMTTGTIYMFDLLIETQCSVRLVLQLFAAVKYWFTTVVWYHRMQLNKVRHHVMLVHH